MNWRLNAMVSALSGQGLRAGTVTGVRGRRRTAPRGLIVATLAACLCGPVASAMATPMTAPIEHSTGASPSTQPPYARTHAADASGYAAREAGSKDLEDFKGGEPVVIVTSTAVLIVAVIILILLI